MEHEALYRAILAAPHDDTPRLVYADWLDENADSLPEVSARSQKARAEFIRVQCAIARSGGTPDPELVRREKRLLFTQGKKWRREFPVGLSSSPFDRGFPRPLRAIPVARFPRDTDESFGAAPLWDVHLYATDYRNDPSADRGQYVGTLAEIGRSPALERIGWLKVSFFRTPTTDFLRTGNFANVETLVLNCGPFPEVLDAVVANESFRNLRYVRFGPDRWAWVRELTDFINYTAIVKKLEAANGRHLPYGEMRAELRTILGQVAAEPVPPELAPLIVPPPVPRIPLPRSDVARAEYAASSLGCLIGGCLLGALFVVLGDSMSFSPRTPTVPTIRIPDFNPAAPQLPDPAVMKLLEEMNAERKAAPKRKDE